MGLEEPGVFAAYEVDRSSDSDETLNCTKLEKRLGCILCCKRHKKKEKHGGGGPGWSPWELNCTVTPQRE